MNGQVTPIKDRCEGFSVRGEQEFQVNTTFHTPLCILSASLPEKKGFQQTRRSPLPCLLDETAHIFALHYYVADHAPVPSREHSSLCDTPERDIFVHQARYTLFVQGFAADSPSRKMSLVHDGMDGGDADDLDQVTS